jgi:thiamine transport system permease protein
MDGNRSTVVHSTEQATRNTKKVLRVACSVVLWLLPIAFLALFYFYPLTSIFGLSFARSQDGWLASMITTLAAPSTRSVLGFTFWQAVLSTALTLLVGLPGAYLVARFRFRGRSLLLALTAIPFVMPTLVVATAFNALLGPSGWLNLALMRLFAFTQPPLELTNTLGAILLAHVFYNATIVIRMVGDFWSHLDPRLGQAAQVLGANRWQALMRVTLPLLLPAILAAALLVFLFCFTSFGVILVLGGPQFATLEVEIYHQTVGLFNLPAAATLSLLQLACTLAMTVLYARLAAQLTSPLSLRPQTYTQQRLTTWRSKFIAASIATLLGTLLLAPLVALALRSVTNLEATRGQSAQPAHLTLDYYRELSVNRRGSSFYAPPTTAITLSLGYAAATVLLSLAMGLPTAWLLARARSSSGLMAIAGKLLDPLLMLPLGTSAVTLGLGFIVALDHPPLDLRSSPLLIPLAHTLVAFPFVVRSLTPALYSIRPSLHGAAALLGASPGQVAWRIDLPLVGRAVIVAAAFAFTISLGEFGATALIARPEYPTIPVAIYRFLSRPGGLNYGQALALSTVLMLTCAAGMLTIERLRIADVGEF